MVKMVGLRGAEEVEQHILVQWVDGEVVVEVLLLVLH